MSLLQQGEVWWYEFWFAGRRIRESTKSESKIVAKAAEKSRRRERKNANRPVADNRHTLSTDPAESGAGDRTILDIAGPVSKRMLRHYSHIRMEAKRTALQSIVKKQPNDSAEKKENSQAG